MQIETTEQTNQGHSIVIAMLHSRNSDASSRRSTLNEVVINDSRSSFQVNDSGRNPGGQVSVKFILLLVACVPLLIQGLGNQNALVQLASAQQVAPSQQPMAQQLIQLESINLQSILQHQEALSAECHQYKLAKERELAYLLQYNQENDQVSLPEPMPIKVPAVCLLFLAAELDDALAPNGSGSGATGQQVVSKPVTPKLEMVNWIFNEEDIKFPSLSKSNNSGTTRAKRDVAANGQLDQSSLLSNYLLDPLVGTTSSQKLQPTEDPEMAKFHNDVNALLANEQFLQGMHAASAKLANHLSPVILIPGLLGSRLQARTQKTTRVNVFCSKESDWYDIWLSVRMFLPIAVNCWLDNARMVYDPETGFTKEPPGVEARVPEFGSVESVRHLDKNLPTSTAYFDPLIERYEQLGYTADVNLLAAPYDFRLAPQQMGQYFIDLKALIDNSKYNSPSGKKVTLVCHSMGCTHALVFLRQQTPAWRQANIRKLIALSSPWAGTAKALKALVVGDSLDLPLVGEKNMRMLSRTYPSIAYLLPQAEVFQMPNQNALQSGGPILVQTPARSYKVGDLEDLMRDLNLTTQYRWFKESSALIKPLEPLPDVNIDCVQSSNVPTPETLIFRNQQDFPNGDFELVNGNGDGTVNLQSLSVCNLWAQMLPERVKQTEILNTNHISVIKHKTTLTLLTDDVLMS